MLKSLSLLSSAGGQAGSYTSVPKCMQEGDARHFFGKQRLQGVLSTEQTPSYSLQQWGGTGSFLQQIYRGRNNLHPCAQHSEIYSIITKPQAGTAAGDTFLLRTSVWAVSGCDTEVGWLWDRALGPSPPPPLQENSAF